MYSSKRKSKRSSVAKEPVVEYKKKNPVQQLLVSPKNKKSLQSLKRLFDKLEDIELVEVIENGEVKDDELLKRMKRNLKSGYVSREKVMTSLRKVTGQK